MSSKSTHMALSWTMTAVGVELVVVAEVDVEDLVVA